MKYHNIISIYVLILLIQGPVNAEEILILSQPVPIISSSNPKIFPDSWLSERIDAQAEILLDKDEVDRSKHILNRAISKYPSHVINENLSAVYILHRLRFKGINAGGTNSKTNIYIVNRGSSKGFTDSWIEETFHNEFSSVLFREFHEYLKIEEWKDINKPTFQYGNSGVEALRTGKSSKIGETSFYEEGFLHQYATSTVENDFNSIAGKLFMGEKKFWSIVKQYDRIRRKVALAINFYNKLDPVLTEDYFYSLQATD